MCQQVHKAVTTLNLKNPTINDLPNLEKYFKYKIIVLDENYLDSEKVVYVNKDANYEKNIYLQKKLWGYNVIDSIKSYCGKYYFCELCVDIFSFASDHACPLRIC